MMVEQALVRPHERVLEIGAGKGALTKELCRVSESVEAFEVDRDNLAEVMALGLKGLSLHLGDAFFEGREFDVLVSSLPYSESSRFVEWLAQHRYDRAVVMLQKDFVEKLIAGPGDEAYRAISVISQISSSVEPLFGVERSAFSPEPRVDSVVSLIRSRRVITREEIRFIKLVFSQKRRRLRGVLRRLGLKLHGPDDMVLSQRVECLTPEEVFLVLKETKRSL